MPWNSSIKDILYQEYNPDLDDKWLTDNEQLTHFRKYRYFIVGRFKVVEFPYVQGPQYSEKDLVVKERFPRRTERISVSEPVNNGNHVPIGQEHNGGYSECQ